MIIIHLKPHPHQPHVKASCRKQQIKAVAICCPCVQLEEFNKWQLYTCCLNVQLEHRWLVAKNGKNLNVQLIESNRSINHFQQLTASFLLGCSTCRQKFTHWQNWQELFNLLLWTRFTSTCCWCKWGFTDWQAHPNPATVAVRNAEMHIFFSRKGSNCIFSRSSTAMSINASNYDIFFTDYGRVLSSLFIRITPANNLFAITPKTWCRIVKQHITP